MTTQNTQTKSTPTPSPHALVSKYYISLALHPPSNVEVEQCVVIMMCRILIGGFTVTWLLVEWGTRRRRLLTDKEGEDGIKDITDGKQHGMVNREGEREARSPGQTSSWITNARAFACCAFSPTAVYYERSGQS